MFLKALNCERTSSSAADLWCMWVCMCLSLRLGIYVRKPNSNMGGKIKYNFRVEAIRDNKLAMQKQKLGESITKPMIITQRLKCCCNNRSMQSGGKFRAEIK